MYSSLNVATTDHVVHFRQVNFDWIQLNLKMKIKKHRFFTIPFTENNGIFKEVKQQIYIHTNKHFVTHPYFSIDVAWHNNIYIYFFLLHPQILHKKIQQKTR